MRNLSKSKFLAYRQCPKRLWLEIHKPELRDDSGSEVAFAIGYQVGDVARRVHDPDGCGVKVDIEGLGHGPALALSAALLAEGTGPVFGAGVTIPGALAYADVMLPDRSEGALRWRMPKGGYTAVAPCRTTDSARDKGTPANRSPVSHLSTDASTTISPSFTALTPVSILVRVTREMSQPARWQAPANWSWVMLLASRCLRTRSPIRLRLGIAG